MSYLHNILVDPGDIIGIRGTKYFSRAILRRSERKVGPLWRRRYERQPVISHVGLVTHTSRLAIAPIVEAAGGKVRETYFGTHYLQGQGVVVMRPLNIPNHELQAIVGYARAKEGETYGFGDILLHAINNITGWDWARRLVSEKRPICSVLVAASYGNQGYAFGMPSNMARPNDIYHFALDNPDKYKFIVGPVPEVLS